jgi:choline dehydrogenase-like flavoprotein
MGERANLQLLHVNTRTYAIDEEVDAVVIGTGAGGAPVMARLAAAGLSVVALEAGKRWHPSKDFATDERSQEKLFWAHERLSAGSDPLGFGSNNSGTGVGGSTLHYTAYTPRPQPDDLQLRTEFGVGCDWPLKFAELEPYFDEVEQFLGVSGPSPYPWGPRRKSAYPNAPLPLNGAAQLMRRACDILGIRTSPAANAALSAPYFQPGHGWRPACTNRGFCQAGCSTGAKASMDVTYIPLAIQHGCEVRPECFVTQIKVDGSNRVRAIAYVHHGTEHEQRCKALFLCCGAIETPRLLLMNRLANSSGQVGKNFMAHVGVQVRGQFAEDVRPNKGIPGGLISEETHRPSDADFAGGYLIQSIGVMPVTYASQLARGRGLWGKSLHDHMSRYNHTAGINVLGECLPHDHNYMELSDERDDLGLYKPVVNFTWGENERRMNEHAEVLMRRIWEEAGAKDIWAFPRGAHTIGTCRMGDDPHNSVVDRDGRSFDVPNLFISDNSTFPSALSANPALMIMALALRTADRFIGGVVSTTKIDSHLNELPLLRQGTSL